MKDGLYGCPCSFDIFPIPLKAAFLNPGAQSFRLSEIPQTSSCRCGSGLNFAAIFDFRALKTSKSAGLVFCYVRDG